MLLLEGARGINRAKPMSGRLALWGTIFLSAGSAHAATFTVANNLDSGDGSLRAAIASANAATGADTINFGATIGSAILLKSALPVLSGTLSINGPGVKNLSVVRDGGTQFRIFAIAPGSTVTIAGLNIVGGDVSGLGGDDEDELESSAVGGNIYNDGGTLTIRDSIVFRGKAVVGGGIVNDGGTLNIISSTIANNKSTEDGSGAGIANAGTLNIRNSGITDNKAEDDGGGIFHLTGTMTIENSSISGNECAFGGGGIVTGGSDQPDSKLITRISNSFIGNNESYNSAGGIDSSDGTMTITNSTLSGNTAGSTDGVNRGGGGAISNRRATLMISGSTFSGNSADYGGAISNGQGALTITNSTFSGNSANSGAAISGGDGAITIESSTITLNKAGVGAGVFGRAKISNSIVSGNVGPDLQGNSTSGGYNLIGATIGPAFAATGDRVGINDPKLGPLSDNGGPTFTHLPQAGSPAIDAGDTALTIDQRGEARPKGKADDIGSVESAGVASSSVLSIANAGAVKEGNVVSNYAEFVVTLTPAATQEVRVGYRAINGTAIENSDFEKIPSDAQVVFAPGETSKTIEVRIVADDEVEPNETFAIELITPQNATINPQAASGTATIVDDDKAALTLSIIPGTFSEAAGANAARGVVSRNTATTTALTVNLSSSNTAKATVPATVVIPAGQTSANFTVSAVDNAIVDGPKKVTISAAATGLETANLDLTVTDNDSTTPPTNTPPVAAPRDVSTKTGVPVNITLGASDANNDALTFSIVKQPENGTLAGSGANVRYTSKAGFTGSDSFAFKANDGKADSNVATVLVQVLANVPTNTAPVASNLRLQTRKNAPLVLALIATDADAADNLTYRIVTQPKNGTLSGPLPRLTYTPNANFSGVDSFTFVANDGKADSNVGTIMVQVLAKANTPPVANNQTLTTKQNTPLIVTPSGTDADGDTLTYLIVTQPTNGKLTSVAGKLIYTPNAGFVGVDSFTFAADDELATSKPARISIQVQSSSTGTVTANPDTYTLAIGAAEQSAGVTFVTSDAFPNGFFRIAAPGLLANDRDSAGGTLQARIVTYPKTGRIRVNSDGSFDYLPSNGFAGSDEFTYFATNGTSRAVSTVTLFTIDQRGPELRFDTPRDGATLNAVTEIKGRVRDLSTPIVSPTLLWRRFDGKYWNGNMWVSEAVELILSVDSGIGFFYVGPLPQPGTNADTNLLDGEYKLRVTAGNTFGNLTRITNTITIRSDAPNAPGTSNVRFSSAGASAASDSIVLRFTGALGVASANDAMNYAVSVNGDAREIGSVSYANNTITLSDLELNADDEIELRVSDLLDAIGKTLRGGSINLIAR